MTDFRQIADEFWASPQITLADVDLAKQQGFVLIVNNRPEGEADDQVPGAQIEAATRDVGMPATPIAPSASRTSSSLNGLMMAMMNFITDPCCLPSDPRP